VSVRAQSLENEIVTSSVEVLDDLVASPDKGIPRKLLHDSRAVAVFPHVIKAGFIVGGRHGRGVIVVRNDDNTWSNPAFLTITGGSVGFQAGAQSTDIVLVFRTKAGVDAILTGRDRLKLGGDISVAAGPVGRETGVATDGDFRSEIYSYSRSRGLFAGAALEGAQLKNDWFSNEAYYDNEVLAPRDIVTKKDLPVREPTALLQRTLMSIAGKKTDVPNGPTASKVR
jgi:lipid-binding SYLF domain-containing protein